jgi:formylglycine-generating enzyme required for sulfatase activity
VSDDAGGTHAVGAFLKGASPYGVLDMAGNVWEWCADWYDKDFWTDQHGSDTNPINDKVSDSRVLRGGSWRFLQPINFRTADRSKERPENFLPDDGFRAVVSVERTP